MHDERVGTRLLDRAGEMFQRLLGILLVDADAAFYCHGYRNGRLHCRNAFAHERRLRHQASAEAAVLHPVGRTADIEIDFIEAAICADARASGKRSRIGAAELQRQRMLRGIITKQPRRDRRAALRRW